MVFVFGVAFGGITYNLKMIPVVVFNFIGGGRMALIAYPL